MEASVSGTPAAADTAQTQPTAPATQPAAADLAPAGTVPPVGQPEQIAGEDDVLSQLKSMEDRVAAAEAQLQGQQPGQPADLLSALSGQPADDGLADLGITAEDLAALSAQGQQEPNADPQAELKELDEYVNERIQQAVDPLVRERREEQVRALQTKYPDIVEPKILEGVESRLSNLVQRYGDESLKWDPEMVEMTYKAVKAELADAGAVPAELAARHGASIETQAGQSQVGEPSVEDQYVTALTRGADGGDEFT